MSPLPLKGKSTLLFLGNRLLGGAHRFSCMGVDGDLTGVTPPVW